VATTNIHITEWKNLVLGEELSCMREIGNPYDPIAVVMQKKLAVLL